MTINEVMNHDSCMLPEKEFDKMIMDAIQKVKEGKDIKALDITRSLDVDDDAYMITLSVSYNGWSYCGTSVCVYK